MVCATIKGSDQPAHMRSLISAFSMNIKLLTEHHFEVLSLKGGCTSLSESIHVKMPHCWKSHVAAHLPIIKVRTIFSQKRGPPRGFVEQGKQGIYIRETGEQRQYWGTGNIRKQIFDFWETGEQANLLQGNKGTGTPWEGFKRIQQFRKFIT